VANLFISAKPNPAYNVKIKVKGFFLLTLTSYAGFSPAYPMKGAQRLSSKNDFKDFDFKRFGFYQNNFPLFSITRISDLWNGSSVDTSSKSTFNSRQIVLSAER